MEISEVDRNSREELENYIKENLSKGYSINAIKKVLVDNGLGSSFVDNLVSGYYAKGLSKRRVEKKVKSPKGELDNYIKKNLAKGYSSSAIKKVLVNSGLERSFVNKAMRKYYIKNVLVSPAFVVMIILMVASLLLFKLVTVGLAPIIPPELLTVSYDYMDEVNLSVNESSEYIWYMENIGLLKSVRLDGSVSKGGYFEVYLEYENESYLILDSLRLGGGVGDVSGLAVGDIVNESSLDEESGGDIDVGIEGEPINNKSTIDEPLDDRLVINSSIIDNSLNNKSIKNKKIIITTEGGGRKDRGEIFEFNIKGEFNWDVDYSKVCSKWDVNHVSVCYGSSECCALIGLESLGSWNDSFYLSYGRYDSGLENVIFVQVIYSNYSLDIEKPYADIVYSDVSLLEADFYKARISFRDVCVETCMLPGFNASSYKIRFVVSNGSLVVDNIRYSIEKEIFVSRNAPLLVREIDNISIYKNEFMNIDLSSYFYDEDGDNLTYIAYEVEDISVVIRDSIATLRPAYNFTGKRYIYFTAFDGYYNVSSNVFSVNVVEKPLKVGEVNVSEELVKPSVVINKPVRWVKVVNASDRVINLSVNISSDALNVSVRDVKEDRMISAEKIKIIDKGIVKNYSVYRAEKRIFQIEEIEDRLTSKKVEIIREDPTAMQEISSINEELLKLQNERNKLTGYVVVGKEEKGLIIRFFEWLFNVDITGYAVAEFVEGSNVTSVIIEDIVEEVEIEYYTEGPVSEEEEIINGKRIVVSSDLHYEDILAYTYLDDVPQKGIRLYRIVNKSRELVSDASYYDENNNGLIDYIEWVIPSLSNETYEVIVITKAEHLDENRSFVADIYDYVYRLDGNWSEPINDGEYVRVTFEIPLDNTRDITIYPRVVNGTPRIEVYEVYGDNVIAEFVNISSNDYNKVYLTELEGEQDVFDLKVVCELPLRGNESLSTNDSLWESHKLLRNLTPRPTPTGNDSIPELSSCDVEFDHIVDPEYGIFFDGFEDAQEWTYWEETSGTAWVNSYNGGCGIGNCGEGSQCACEENGGTSILAMIDPVDLVNYDVCILTYATFVDSSLGNNEYLYVDVTNSAGSWVNIYFCTNGYSCENNQWTLQSYSINQGVGLNSNFKVRVRAVGNDNGEEVGIDNVKISCFYSPDCWDAGTSPHPICSCYDLQNINSQLSWNYKLQNDIDCSLTNPNNPYNPGSLWDNGGLGFEPIGKKDEPFGTNDEPFTGTFDGQNYVVTGLYIDRTGYDFMGIGVGLFGSTSATAEIKNVGLENVNIDGYGRTGALVGYNYGKISNSYSDGIVKGGGSGMYGYDVGGLVGDNYEGTITNSYSAANIQGSGVGRHGGLVGSNWWNGNINNSYSTGSVSGTTMVGGFIGLNQGGAINNSYSTGSVSGTTMVGGFAGDNSAYITNSYSTGAVSGSSEVGGFAGDSAGGACRNCFWDTSGYPTSDPDCGTGKSTTDMKKRNTFESATWDFVNIWGIKEDASYPLLRGLDRGAPSVTVESPLTQFYNTQSIEFRVTATDDSYMDKCEYDLDLAGRVEMTNTDPVFSYTDPSVIEGRHTVDFYCSDIFDNENADESADFGVDIADPQINFEAPTPDPGVTISGDQFTIQYDASDNNYISSFIDFDRSLIGWWRMDEVGSDDFTGTVIDDSKWRVGISGGGEITQNDKIQETTGNNPSAYDVSNLRSNFYLKGDFDIQVDFSLIDFEGVDNSYALLRVYNVGSGKIFSIGRQKYTGGAGDVYYANFNDDGVSHGYTSKGTVDMAGKFRITRVSGTVTPYYWDGNDWVAMTGYITVNFTEDVEVILYVAARNESINVTYDNFIVNKGEAVLDRSSYRHNATAVGDAVQTYSGKLGKGFEFDGDGDYVNISDMTLMTSGSSDIISVSVWIKSAITDYPSDGVNQFGIVAKRDEFFFGVTDEDDFTIGTYGGDIDSTSCGSIDLDWHHMVFIYDEGNNNGYIYQDGSLLCSGTLSDDSGESTYHFLIGMLEITTGVNQEFNGIIDDVMIFNRPLSLGEIQALYADTNNKQDVSEIFTGLASGNHNFKAYVQDIAGKIGETEKRTVTVNFPPTATLQQPDDQECISGPPPDCDLDYNMDRRIGFSWTGNDFESDPITYTLILTGPNGGTFSPVTSPYTPSNILNTGATYSWKIMACDAWGCTDSETRTFVVPSVVDITLTTSSVNFGTIKHGATDNSEDDSPPPFVVQNDGNVNTDIKVFGNYFWQAAGGLYQSKAGGMVEAGSYTWAGSQQSFGDIHSTEQAQEVINKLKWADTEDSAEIDILLKVPVTEPTDPISKDITIKGVQDE